MDGVPDAPRVSRSMSPLAPAALYQVSAANHRDILIRPVHEHAMRCLPRHVLGFRRLKGGDGRSRGKRRRRLVKFWHTEGTCLITITISWGRRASENQGNNTNQVLPCLKKVTQLLTNGVSVGIIKV